MGPDCREEHLEFMENPKKWWRNNPDLVYEFNAKRPADMEQIFQKARYNKQKLLLEETKSEAELRGVD